MVAFANHLMTRKRELEAKQREIALSRLVEAWLALDAASEKPGIRDGDLAKLEEAIRTIVLFGEDQEIDIAIRVGQSMASEQKAQFTDLLVALRKRIRASMGIRGKDRHYWFAVKPPSTPATPEPSPAQGEGREGVSHKKGEGV